MSSKIRAVAVALGALALANCTAGPPAAPSPADLPALEAAAQQNPRDAGLLTRLGIGYYDARQYARSRDVLNSALTITRENFAAHVYLGLDYEELGQMDSARVMYTTAAGQAAGPRQRGEIEDRLLLLTRRELQVAARQAIAQEAALSSQAPVANAVAVFPFRYAGGNADLEPLGRGLTHVMITDLSKLDQLTLLERERVQALVDELALADQGKVDPATGARSGRMLRAARVVQGTIQDVPGRTDLRFDATVVDAARATVVATGNASDQLAQLFTMEKQVLFRLLDQMGITLSPAERRELSERPTADMQAFLAFSRGLEAEDRGDFAGAEASFNAALARDPNFRQARERRDASQKMAAIVQVPAAQLAGLMPDGRFGDAGPRTEGDASPATTQVGRGTVLRNGVINTVPTVSATLTNRVGSPVPTGPATRPPLPEALGGDDPTSTGLQGTIIIIITRP